MNEIADSRCYELIAEPQYFDVVYAFVKFCFMKRLTDRYFGQLGDSTKSQFLETLLRCGRGFVVTSINKPVSSESLLPFKNALFM